MTTARTFDEFIGNFTDVLGRNGIKFVVLRNYEGFPPENIGSDIDVLVRPEDMGGVSKLLIDREFGAPISVFWRAYLLTVFLEVGEGAVQVDFVHDLAWKGLPYLSVDDVVNRARRLEAMPSVYIPDEIDEASIKLLASLLIGGWLNSRYIDYVQKTYRQRTEESVERLSEYFGYRLANDVVSAVVDSEHHVLRTLVKKMRLRLLRLLLKKPRLVYSMMVHHIGEVSASFRREGRFEICLLGVDGAGKSTIVKNIKPVLKRYSKGLDVVHLKPRLFPHKKSLSDEEKSVPPDHLMAPRNGGGALLKLLYWLVLYWKRRFLRRRHHQITIWDRYIYDAIADPRRYRIGLSSGVRRFMASLAPRPNVVCILQLDSSSVLARKDEVSGEVLSELIIRYESLPNLLPSCEKVVSVDASRPLTDVVEEVLTCIRDGMRGVAIMGIRKFRKGRRYER